MRDKPPQDDQFPVRLTKAQRKIVAELAAQFSERLRLHLPNERLVLFTLGELREIHEKSLLALPDTESGMKRNSLRHIGAATSDAIEYFQGIGRIPAKERVYQFRISLRDIAPPIWRRIQVKDCTLDKLHERIQTAMGWTNSHLHHFRLNGKLYGDPLLMEEDFEESRYMDSTVTWLSKVIPRSGKRFTFEYEYDFGDSWWHDVLFEGCLRAAPGQRYPFCVEGERACPPEDVGGSSSYRRFVKVIANPHHREHENQLVWVGGSFDSEAFDAEKATKRMQRGLPNRRTMA